MVNPATGEVIAEAPLSTQADVDAAVAAAKGAFEGWAATPPGERARALLRIADLIEERGEELAASRPPTPASRAAPCSRTRCR